MTRAARDVESFCSVQDSVAELQLTWSQGADVARTFDGETLTEV